MRETKKLNVYALCQCGIFIALATILSFLPVIEMPMGGSVTLASMLPILLIGVKFGYKWGLGSATVFMVMQLLQSLIKGNVFVWCTTAGAVIICVLFDYVVPFTILGLSAFAKPSAGKPISIPKVLVTFSVLIFGRFLCHFITGMTIWGQWDDGFWGAFIYSLSYNGSYMGIELVLTVVVAGLLLSSKQIEKLIAEK
ncbi:MAG: energy-coupled thiamine transporter ThiT [Clostridia bacterium]|nr:energy-coupled thiamine transporter ThiT [Clostridia bacterium]